MPLSKRWQIQNALTPQADESLRVFPPIIRQILFNRGIATDSEARAFLKAETPFDTSPWQLKDMALAVERIEYAIDHHEQIIIYGDYDVDGVTATALLVQTLRALDADVDGYIPNRFDEGYGLNNEALDGIKEKGVSLVISVDCGIRSPAEALHAKNISLDLIITDHHHPADDLPPAFAILNPKQKDDLYPDKDLAGVGVACKLAEALLERRASTLVVEDLLDLVALGTVADLAPLVGENRSLVRRGLKQIRETRRQGLFSLANVAGLTISKTTATDIGFILGPRLNAAGRLAEAEASLTLLTTSDLNEAGGLAQNLDSRNRERQQLTREIQAQAEVLALKEEKEPLILFAVSPEFNAGVVGLAAARLVESHYLPAVVGRQDQDTTRCSCRSIPEFHITNALDECADLLIRHGGHAAAAGFTVRNDCWPELVSRLRVIAARELFGRDLHQTLVADIEVALGDLTLELLRYLDYLEPTGYGNRDAVFIARDLRIATSKTVGTEGKHLKLTLTDGSIFFNAIAFRLGHLQPGLPPRVDVMFTFERNFYKEHEYLQMNLRDIHPAGGAS